MLSFLKEHRRRIAPLVLGAAVLVVGHEWQDHAPRDVELELPIGASHADVRQVDVRLEESDELVRAVTLRYPEGAPERVRQTVELAPGRYTARVDLTLAEGRSRALTGSFDAPAEGVIRIHLEEDGT